MEPVRKSFQGVWNIIRFNWHFYLIATLFLALLFALKDVFANPFSLWILLIICLALGSIVVSLLVSFYVYDLSGLYNFSWVKSTGKGSGKNILNINAGFDEVTPILKTQYPLADIKVFDFYDPEKHTEVSIKRARKAYPPTANSICVNTTSLPLNGNSTDTIFVVFSAHEIRNEAERVAFFKELARGLRPEGEIVVTEHLRDVPNFLAYNVGFFHFYSRKTWGKVFLSANLEVKKEFKLTPFITTFILVKNGASL